MQRYEYKVVQVPHSTWSTKRSATKQEQMLSELDAEGWELVSSVGISAFVTYASMLYLRRPR